MFVIKKATRLVLAMFSYLLTATLIFSSCGGNRALSTPQLYGARPAVVQDTTIGDTAVANNDLPLKEAIAAVPEHKGNQASQDVPPTETDTVAVTVTKESDTQESAQSKEPGSVSTSRAEAPLERSAQELALYYGRVDNEDSASAVDDHIWRLFDIAEEYIAMGVIANREASWEEAQYYFEKSLKIMANLDIEADSMLTPEAIKYTHLLDDIIAEYRVTLRSLGQLEGDIAPSVMVERFGELGARLGQDSLRVFKGESRPITFDLPVKINDRVKSSIIYYQTVARDFIHKTHARSKRYENLFRETLKKYGLPQDLIYLSLVESGLNPNAYSWARAMGLWQFISSTGRMYDLNRSWWIDERKDPVKSTDAAARFLKDLYKQFGDWELAMAAYNGGPGRVSRTMKRQKTIDFWRLKLRRQTMDYVPLIYAAAIIHKDPEKYGFSFDNIEVEPEVVWDKVTVNRCLDLKVVASELGCSIAELKKLNPELLRNYTPPNTKKYVLKIPVGSKHRFLAAYESMPSPKETSWVKHKIRRGETISTIAAKYGVSQYAVFEANNLKRRSRIYAGKTLIVPVPLDRDNTNWRRNKNGNYSSEKSMYTVRSGDTMWDIAKAFGTTVNALRRINYIERGSRIYVGQKLKIPSSARNLGKLNKAVDKTYASRSTGPSVGSRSSKDKSSSSTTNRKYTVRVGDTLWEIARHFGTTTRRLRELNGMGRSSRIYPNQVLVVEGADGQDYVIHKVKRGDTISRIARSYRTTIAKILTANHLTDPDNIRIGDKLKINTK